jgi:archaellum component FlaC
MDPRETIESAQRGNGTGHGSNAYTLAALGIAELRTSVSSELTRIKDDIGELHEKINSVKDGVATDKVALITQLNQEFTALNRRLSDFSLAVQTLMSDAEHSGEMLKTKLEQLTTDFEHKLEGLRNEFSRMIPETKLNELDNAVSGLRGLVEGVSQAFDKFMDSHDSNAETSNDELSEELKRYALRKAKDVRTELEGEISGLKKTVEELEEKDKKHAARLAALDKRVTKLAAKVTAGVAALAWILNALFGDSAKSMVGKMVSPQTQSVIEAAKSKPVAVDGTQIKDSGTMRPTGHQ